MTTTNITAELGTQNNETITAESGINHTPTSIESKGLQRSSQFSTIEIELATIMSSILLLCLCIDRLSNVNAFVIAKNHIQNSIFVRNTDSFSSTSIFSSSHKSRASINGVDESEWNALKRQLEEKDWEIEDMRAEIDALSAHIQGFEHQHRQFNEYYPLFCEQMKEKSAKIEALEETIKEFEETSQKKSSGSEEGDDKTHADDFELEDLKQKYEMELAFVSHDMASKEAEIESLKQKIENLKTGSEEESLVVSSELDELKQKYEMEKAFNAQDMIAKNTQIEQLTEEIVVMKQEMNEAEVKYSKKCDELQEQMVSEKKNSANRIEQLEKKIDHSDSENNLQADFVNEKLTKEANERLLNSNDTHRPLKSHFLEGTFNRNGGQVMASPNDIVNFK